MAIRIPWDEYEAAFLIDKCVNVENGELLRSDAVSQVSRALRERAQYLGVEIDDLFRNENGISLQMSHVLYILTDGEKGLPGGSKLFEKLVALWKNESTTFYDILKNPINPRQILTTNDPNPTQKRSFTIPRKKKIDFAHIGNMAFTAPVSYKYGSHYTREVDSWQALYCEVIKSLSRDFPEIFKNEASFSWKEIMGFSDIKGAKKLKKPIRIRPGFYAETAYDTAGKIRRIRNMLAACELSQDALVIKYYYDKAAKESHDINIIARQSQATIYFVDWSKSRDYAGTRPVSYKYKTHRFKEVKSWSRLWISLLSEVYKEYPAKFKSGFAYSHGAKCDVGGKRHAKNMIRPVEIAAGIYAESNMGPNSIIKRIEAVMELIKAKPSDIKISFMQKSDVAFWGGADQMNTDIWQAFLQWLQQEKGSTIAKDTLSKLMMVNMFGRKNGKLTVAINQITDAEEIERIQTNVLHSSAFGVHSKKMERDAYKALGLYRQFLLSQPTPIEDTTDSNSLKNAFVTWMQEGGMADTTIRSYSSAISEASSFAISKAITSQEIFYMHSKAEVAAIIDELMRDADFALKNDRQHNRLRTALRKYLTFLSSNHPSVTVSLPQKREAADPKWQKVLETAFPDGYILDDFICQFQASAKWMELFNEECPLEGASIDVAMSACGDVVEGRVYGYDERESNLILQICDEICTVLNNYSAAFVMQVHEHYREQLSSNSIYTAEVMAQRLLKTATGSFIKKGNCFVKPGHAPLVLEDCKQILRNHGGGLSVDDIASALWFEPYEMIYHVLSASQDCINIGHSTWMLAEHFPFTEDDAFRIAAILNDEFVQKKYLLNTDLLALIEKECPDISENLSPWNHSAVFNLLRYYLDKQFSFTKSIVAPAGKEIDIKLLFSNFAQSHDNFTLDELEFMAKEIGVPIYWESTYSGAVRISETEFVAANRVHFDVYKTDQVLESLCVGDYLPLKAIQPAMMLHLPHCGYPWNGYLLLSYLYGYSKSFHLYYNSLNKTGYYGALVRCSATQIDSYKKLIERVLTDDDSWHTRNDALALLVSEGYQVMKKLNGIEHIVEQAMLNKNNE